VAVYRAYAKINLTLEVLGKRPDGFHELASVVHTVNLGDDLHVEASGELLTRVEGLDIDPDTNLVSRAARLLSVTLGERRGAELSLVKRIPTAAGLGGGSSDAATTLIALNRLWRGQVGLRGLSELAAQLGSDVPFFVRGGAALMRGRGEQLESLPALVGQWLVLLVPSHDVLDKTRQLYAALQPTDFSDGEATNHAAERLRERTALEASLCVNAFARAARSVFPGLASIWDEAERRSGLTFLLSGAGPALFAFADDRAQARKLATELATSGVQTFAVRTVKHARAIGYP
jgi:4-diphosphocytidyl-2-C-methyl-D-erythritol kinase